MVGSVVAIKERVAAATRRSGRLPTDVRIVAVTKGVDVGRVSAVLRAGLADLGENRAQELQRKVPKVAAGARWHYLGAIQTNKVSYLDGVSFIHSLWRKREAEALEARANRTDSHHQVLLQVNVAAEPTKQGLAPGEVEEMLEALSHCRRLVPRGFMFMAPRTKNTEDVRWIFSRGRELRDRFGLQELSMGMSDDFEIAIEEGATMVRLGRAIFGASLGSNGAEQVKEAR